jgi:hypothetical protein
MVCGRRKRGRGLPTVSVDDGAVAHVAELADDAHGLVVHQDAPPQLWSLFRAPGPCRGRARRLARYASLSGSRYK